MIARRRFLALMSAAIVAAAVAIGWPASAAAMRPFGRAAFDAALKAGGPIVVHVSAPWCPICRAQKPIIARLREDARFQTFEAFEIDFDGDKPSMQAVGARLQSTVIVYNRGREVARTVGDREEGWIEELFEKAAAAGS